VESLPVAKPSRKLHGKDICIFTSLLFSFLIVIFYIVVICIIPSLSSTDSYFIWLTFEGFSITFIFSVCHLFFAFLTWAFRLCPHISITSIISYYCFHLSRGPLFFAFIVCLSFGDSWYENLYRPYQDLIIIIGILGGLNMIWIYVELFVTFQKFRRYQLSKKWIQETFGDCLWGILFLAIIGACIAAGCGLAIAAKHRLDFCTLSLNCSE